MSLQYLIYWASFVLLCINTIKSSIIDYIINKKYWIPFVNIFLIFVSFFFFRFIFARSFEPFKVMGFIAAIIGIFFSIFIKTYKLETTEDERNYSIIESISTIFAVLAAVVFIIAYGNFVPLTKYDKLKYLIPFAISIIFSMIGTAILDKKEEKSKGELVLITILIFFTLLTIIGLFAYVVKPGISTTILIGMLMIFSVLFIMISWGILADKFKEKEIPHEKTKIPDIGPEPADIPVDEKTLEKIIKNLKNFYVIDECRSDKSRSCNYLFQQLVRNKNMTYQDINRILDTMNKDALKNQNIYLVYQLLQCRLILEGAKVSKITEFGTWAWFRENILSNNFQIFIYVICFFVVGGFIAYNIYEFFLKSKLISGVMERYSIFKVFGGYNSVIAFFIFLLIVGLYIMFYGFSAETGVKYYYDVPEKLKKYIHDKLGTTSSQIEERFGSWSVFALVALTVIITIISTIASRIGDNIFTKIIKTANIILWLGLLFSFNIYYALIIPQLVLIAIILQKFIVDTPLVIESMNDLMFIVIKGIILIVVLVASLWGTQYGTEGEKNGDKKVMTKGVYNKQVWFIFGVLMTFYFANIVNSFIAPKVGYKENEWTLILMPILRYIFGISTGEWPDSGYLSVSNKF